MDLLTALQESDVSRWIASSPSLLAYPMFLTLHTVGMAIVVGTCVALDLRVLGVASDVPLAAFSGAPRLVWSGFVVNAATGTALFMIDAEHKATQWIFYVKLLLIALALIIYARTRRLVAVTSSGGEPLVPLRARTLAIVSLLLWTGATVAGRLMAYII